MLCQPIPIYNCKNGTPKKKKNNNNNFCSNVTHFSHLSHVKNYITLLNTSQNQCRYILYQSRSELTLLSCLLIKIY